MFEVPVNLRRRGVEARLIIPGSSHARRLVDPALCCLVARARLWFDQLTSGDAPSIRAIADRDGVYETEVGRALQLAFLAPDIVEAILDGRQPVELTADRLLRAKPLPENWRDQRRLLGFEE